jgi:hypothetical protein
MSRSAVVESEFGWISGAVFGSFEAMWTLPREVGRQGWAQSRKPASRSTPVEPSGCVT